MNKTLRIDNGFDFEGGRRIGRPASQYQFYETVCIMPWGNRRTGGTRKARKAIGITIAAAYMYS